MSDKSKQTPEIEENMLVSWFESKFAFLQPHYKVIGLVSAILVLACVLGAILYQTNADTYASQWNQFNLALTNFANDQKTDHLTSMADEIPGTQASLWALQLAGDQELNMGLARLTNPSRFPEEDIDDLRPNAIRMIEKAQANFEKVLASGINRPDHLQVRTAFSLARALESLGQWDESNKYYKQVVEFAPEGEFSAKAKRGVVRTSDSTLQAFYDNFRTSKIGIAPGITLPEDDEPNIGFPDLTPEQLGLGSTAPENNEIEIDSPESEEANNDSDEGNSEGEATPNDSEPILDDSEPGDGETENTEDENTEGESESTDDENNQQDDEDSKTGDSDQSR